jgi:hypothetical protein
MLPALWVALGFSMSGAAQGCSLRDLDLSVSSVLWAVCMVVSNPNQRPNSPARQSHNLFTDKEIRPQACGHWPRTPGQEAAEPHLQPRAVQMKLALSSWCLLKNIIGI